MNNSSNKLDLNLIFTIFFLLFFGLIMIASAGVGYSENRFGDPYYFFKHQLFFGVIPGLIAFYLAQKIKYSFWKKISFPLFAISIVFLILVFIPGFGTKIYGASRWLKLGSFSFQPAEMLKLSIIVYLAAWLEGRSEKVKDFYEGLIPFGIIVAIVSFLLINQPDMGTLGIVILISISIFFISGARIKHLFLVALIGLVSFFIMIRTESYRMDRFLVFLHPEIDPQGIGYQINQALLAIGSGGIWGRGLGHSLQKFNYLPEPVGDSIFAIIGEEFGFAGCVFLIFVFLFLGLKSVRIIQRAPDRFSKLVATGVFSWIIFQTFTNIAAILGLIPLTGIPLPFISYGGTSVIFLMVAVGILFNISKYGENNNKK